MNKRIKKKYWKSHIRIFTTHTYTYEHIKQICINHILYYMVNRMNTVADDSVRWRGTDIKRASKYMYNNRNRRVLRYIIYKNLKFMRNLQPIVDVLYPTHEHTIVGGEHFQYKSSTFVIKSASNSCEAMMED